MVRGCHFSFASGGCVFLESSRETNAAENASLGWMVKGLAEVANTTKRWLLRRFALLITVRLSSSLRVVDTGKEKETTRERRQRSPKIGWKI